MRHLAYALYWLFFGWLLLSAAHAATVALVTFLLARPVVAAVVCLQASLALVLVGLYGWCYREQL